jgi:hypothetical protein
MPRFSLYYKGPKDTIEIIPDWILKYRCIGVWHLEGYIETKKPILQRDLNIPIEDIDRIEKQYEGKFVKFNRTRPTQRDE